MALNEAELNSLCECNKLELFALYKKYDEYWKERLRKFQEEGGVQPTLEEKYTLMLGQFDELIEQLKQQRRLMRWRNGEQIEPQVHQGGAVLLPNFGGMM